MPEREAMKRQQENLLGPSRGGRIHKLKMPRHATYCWMLFLGRTMPRNFESPGSEVQKRKGKKCVRGSMSGNGSQIRKRGICSVQLFFGEMRDLGKMHEGPC